ncbi:hypothetical protein WJX72_001018 [[Myrmecia] bisecta]|uniref:Uncharacterized protein n=1 Tax=[Myrmecia] bisecta TaxID=41462 RepID=A0AAW1QBF6_9CHLO
MYSALWAFASRQQFEVGREKGSNNDTFLFFADGALICVEEVNLIPKNHNNPPGSDIADLAMIRLAAPRSRFFMCALGPPMVPSRLYALAFVDETYLPETAEGKLAEVPRYRPAFWSSTADHRFRGGAVVDEAGHAIGLCMADPIPTRGRPTFMPVCVLNVYTSVLCEHKGCSMLTPACPSTSSSMQPEGWSDLQSTS